MYKNICKNFEPKRDNLLLILHEIQDSHPQQYITKNAMKYVAEYLKISIAQVKGVISFYTMFSTTPRGKYLIRVCNSTACFIKGSDNVLEILNNILDLEKESIAEDNLFSLETCSCLGVCGNAPVMMINKEVYGNLNEKKIKKIISDLKRGNK